MISGLLMALTGHPHCTIIDYYIGGRTYILTTINGLEEYVCNRTATLEDQRIISNFFTGTEIDINQLICNPANNRLLISFYSDLCSEALNTLPNQPDFIEIKENYTLARAGDNLYTITFGVNDLPIELQFVNITDLIDVHQILLSRRNNEIKISGNLKR